MEYPPRRDAVKYLKIIAADLAKVLTVVAMVLIPALIFLLILYGVIGIGVSADVAACVAITSLMGVVGIAAWINSIIERARK